MSTSAQFKLPRKLKLASIGILIAGLLTSTCIFVATAPADGATDADSARAQSLRFDQNRREMAEVERLGGKVSVMTVQFHQWFLSLWDGRRLAYTVLALAVLCAWACRHIADLIDDEYDG
jgi:hypothetical protein